jgi:hypothetical protein
MATVTKSIGSGKDYSNIAAWISDLSNGAVYSSGDDAIGELYDSSYDEGFVIDDSEFSLDLNSITLRANSSEKHDGTPDSGVKITYTGTVSNETPVYQVAYTTGTYGNDKVMIEDIEFGDITTSASVNFFLIDLGIRSSIMSRCLINNVVHTGPASQTFKVFGPDTQKPVIQNTMIFNCGKDGGAGSSAGKCIAIDVANESYSKINNCTIHNIYDTADTYGGFGGVYINTIITNCDDNFKQSTGSSDYNLSTDSTAPGSNSPVPALITIIYVSTTQGSENLHLRNRAPALRKGSDLGTTNGGQYDIDGYDRDTNEFRWDIGADQCHRCVVGYVPNSKFSSGFMVAQEMGTMSLSDF